MAEVKELELVENETKVDKNRTLVLYNDDVNTFEFVIDSLVKICKHELMQAEQCTWIVHYNGKCSVKEGNFRDLRPMRQALSEKGLTAKIH
ncbi:ATP-dependent Clp protease adaptor ClpS [Paracrocinitomix mangrovi]|uniref:ATP-dependent Clp protease adaptor ClpS n=1 Tax=Paracrocinitomix mangrovi TaxID=2862509 RepID=UPI001C8CF79E|nr:ATP-dependent Clp protease adaptor ClpS [Paracrocinitomix mangrovi]UKN01592.1 ATP-dependent Clp protease adaptor ClpS [Paracrocinitomix mangrovi]